MMARHGCSSTAVGITAAAALIAALLLWRARRLRRSIAPRTLVPQPPPPRPPAALCDSWLLLGLVFMEVDDWRALLNVYFVCREWRQVLRSLPIEQIVMTTDICWRPDDAFDRLRAESNWQLSFNCSRQKCMELRMIALALPRLRRLDLSRIGDHLDDRTLVEVASSCTELTAINLAGCGNCVPCPTDRAISAICSNCRQLQELTPPTEEVSQVFVLKQVAEHCPRLRTLGPLNLSLHSGSYLYPPGSRSDLEFDPATCNEALRVVVAACPRLSVLLLTGVFKQMRLDAAHALRVFEVENGVELSDATVRGVALGSHSLEVFRVSRGSILTNAAIEALGRGCPCLCELSLFDVGLVDGHGLAAIGVGCPRLRKLKLEGVDYDCGLGMERIARGCPSLEHLSLGCGATRAQQPDACLAEFAASCRRLHRVTLRANLLTDEGLGHLFGRCPELEYMTLHDVHEITPRGLHALVSQGLPALRNLSVDMHAVMRGEFVDALLRCRELSPRESARTLKIEVCAEEYKRKFEVRVAGGVLFHPSSRARHAFTERFGLSRNLQGALLSQTI